MGAAMLLDIINIYAFLWHCARVWSWKLLITIHVATSPTNSDISLIFVVTYKVLFATAIILNRFEKVSALKLILWYKKKKRGIIFIYLSLWALLL